MKRRRKDGNSPQPISPPVWDREPYARIDPGRYLVRVVGWQGPEWVRMGQRNSLRLECALSHEQASLSVFFNLGGKRNQIGVPGRQSKYYKHWVMANGAEPRKGETMHWNLFVDKWFIAEVENATTDKDGNTKQEAEIYSRIREFVRREEM